MRRTGSALAVVLSALAMVGLAGCKTAESSPAPTATTAEVAPSEAPLPTTTPTAPIAAAVPVPASCDALYSPGFRATLEAQGFGLNPADKDLSQYKSIGSEDYQLAALLEDALRGPTTPGLTCQWLASAGASLETGLRTNVVAVSDSVSAEAMGRLESMSFSKTSSNGGIRFSYEEHTENGDFGESQFFRDGLWLATAWTGFGPDGYTADMAASVFGA